MSELDTAYTLLMETVKKALVGIELIDRGRIIRVPNSQILESSLAQLQALGSPLRAKEVLEGLSATLRISAQRLLTERTDLLMSFNAEERLHDLGIVLAGQLSYSSIEQRDLSKIHLEWEAHSAQVSSGLLAILEHLSAILFAEVLCRRLLDAVKMVPA